MVMVRNLESSGADVVPPEVPIFCSKVVRIIGAPLAYGQPIPGVDEAPIAIRDAGLSEVCEHVGWSCEDIGDLRFTADEGGDDVKLEERTEFNPEGSVAEMPLAKTMRVNLNGVGCYDNISKCKTIGASCHQIFEAARESARAKCFTLTIGGDHSIATGSISAALSVYPNLVVIWVDAHGDCNTPETSPSGYYHGMPLAHLMGWFKKKAPGFDWLDSVPELREDRVALVGLRDIDKEESELLKASRTHCFTMRQVDGFGIAEVAKEALRRVDPEGVCAIHLSLDIDACDPSIAWGTGTKARGGLTYREIHYLCESLAETRRLVSMDLVEVNPRLDKKDGDKTDEGFHGNQLPIKSDALPTSRLALGLVASALGKAIM